eukprot:Rhum_TRINITY_DN15140_c8_g1::Rhum_TRINITY_DN15140_c8_g1_i1::g.140517::m.140517
MFRRILATAGTAGRRAASTGPGQSFLFNERYSALDRFPTKTALSAYNIALTAAASCGGLDEREYNYVLGLGVLQGLKEEEVRGYLQQEWSDDKIEATIKAFNQAIQDENWKAYLIYDCVKACSADEHYSPEERAKVRKIAHWLGVTDSHVAKIESYVIRQSTVEDAGRSILRGEEE